ncbi:uncharacterized protein [Ptychodera flava]|uniref:uncharacterized protein n=1 Tax=Ptychodera flava TaxID=63121 RepID=UPI003969F01B
MADIFETEIFDKSGRLELVCFINRTVVIECYLKLLDSVHVNVDSDAEKWSLYREVCRSIRIPCCESEDFARKIYKSGIVMKIVNILSEKKLKIRYEEDQIRLDLVSIGLLISAVCCSNVLTPTSSTDIDKMKHVARHYESSTIDSVKTAADLLNKVVGCLPVLVKEEVISDETKDTEQNDVNSNEVQHLQIKHTLKHPTIDAKSSDEERHHTTDVHGTPRGSNRTSSFLRKFTASKTTLNS